MKLTKPQYRIYMYMWDEYMKDHDTTNPQVSFDDFYYTDIKFWCINENILNLSYDDNITKLDKWLNQLQQKGLIKSKYKGNLIYTLIVSRPLLAKVLFNNKDKYISKARMGR